MKRGLLAALTVAAMVVVGCDKDATNSEPNKDTADKAASEAKNSAEKVGSTIKEGAEKKENAGGMMDAASDAIKKQADDLVKQVKTAIDNREWDKAESLIKQLEDLKGKLPKDYQDVIGKQVDNFQQLIKAGKTAMPK